MIPAVTLRELISAVSEYAQSEAEVIATVVHMVNSGVVRLRGHLEGARIDISDRGAAKPAIPSLGTA